MIRQFLRVLFFPPPTAPGTSSFGVFPSGPNSWKHARLYYSSRSHSRMAAGCLAMPAKSSSQVDPLIKGQPGVQIELAVSYQYGRRASAGRPGFGVRPEENLGVVPLCSARCLSELVFAHDRLSSSSQACHFHFPLVDSPNRPATNGPPATLNQTRSNHRSSSDQRTRLATSFLIRTATGRVLPFQ